MDDVDATSVDDTISTTSLCYSSFDDDDDDDNGIEYSTGQGGNNDFNGRRRRVSFTEGIVTDVRVRPFTTKDEIPNLFYSTEELQQFRQDDQSERNRRLGCKTQGRNRDSGQALKINEVELANCFISRCVLVCNNDKQSVKMTFFNSQGQTDLVPKGNDFFDVDSFWTGSLAWY